MSVVTVGWKRVGESVRGLLAPSKYKWNSIHKSVTGAAHVLNGLPNQDAAAAYPENGPTAGIVLAIADGHTEGTHFRSDRGALFAVETAADSMSKRLNQIKRRALDEVRASLENDMPRLLHFAWQERVFADFRTRPFTEEELARVPEERLRRVALNCLVPYGSTMLLAVVTEHFICGLQLGDGDILAVDDDGKVRWLIPPKEESGEATDSLCDRNAHNKFRFCFESYQGAPPAAIVMSTDGYEKSFASDPANFLKLGTDLLRYLREHGPEKVKQDLPEWLSRTSAEGSGDDITLAIAYRLDALRKDHNG